MGDKKRRLLVILPAISAVLSSSMLLVPWSSNVGDGVRGLVVGIAAGISIAALIKLRRASAA